MVHWHHRVTVLLRGGGDLASGVALRLHRVGFRVLVTEISQPLMVRRMVSFGEAVYAGTVMVEGVTARLVPDMEQASLAFQKSEIPVLVDPEAGICRALLPDVIVDGRMLKEFSSSESPGDGSPQDPASPPQPLVIGLGPGFNAGLNCHAAVETRRGHFLGRVLWQGATEANTGIPDPVGEYDRQRVLRAPLAGTHHALAEIGDRLEAGQPVAEVAGQQILAPFNGVLRGILHPGLRVWAGLKIGDVDPRGDPRFCFLASDKSLAVAGGVLEAILTHIQLCQPS